MRRIAIIGGGIAGFGCAWALHRGGLEPTVYEREADAGGNAKTFAWQVGDRSIVTGLSVLAWPARYFHNYGCLLAELGVETEPTPTLRFFVRCDGEVYAHGLEERGNARFASDVTKWERAVAAIRSANAFFAGRGPRDPGSLYDMSPFNPLHLVRLRDVARVIGISRAFWDRVFVPIHSSSFLSVDLDALPASIAPVLEDIVSIRNGGDLITWSNTSRDVFSRMSAGFQDRVHVGRRAVRVERSHDGVEVFDARGGRGAFDAVVFACNAHDALAMLAASGGGAGFRERALLGGIEYADDVDGTFLRGSIHSDASILPDEYRTAILEGFANFVERFEGGDGARFENTFVLSSWVPAARGASRPMLVSYNRRAPVASALATVKNDRAHPTLTRANLARAFLLRTLQGRRRSWYCGSFATPGNGHNLSLLSGLVVADALGAPYPFREDAAAKADFGRLKRFMLGR